jgi:hypothetical protein
MSMEALTWAFAQKTGDPGLKVFLLALADFAGDDHVTWPSRSTLASRVEVSERTISRYTQQLIDMGLITVEERRLDNGARSSNAYRLAIRQPSLLLPTTTSQIGTKPAAATGQHVVSGAETDMGGNTPLPCGDRSIEPSVVPSDEPSKRHTRGQAALAGLELPTWLMDKDGSTEAWDEFVAMRRKMNSRAPFTVGAARETIRDLDRLRRAGDDPIRCLWQSVQRGWRGVFPVKDQQQEQRAGGPTRKRGAQDSVEDIARHLENQR